MADEVLLRLTHSISSSCVLLQSHYAELLALNVPAVLGDGQSVVGQGQVAGFVVVKLVQILIGRSEVLVHDAVTLWLTPNDPVPQQTHPKFLSRYLQFVRSSLRCTHPSTF